MKSIPCFSNCSYRSTSTLFSQILVDARIALDDVQRFSVKRARAGNPGAIVEARDIDDERVAFPVTHRVAVIARNQIVGVLIIQSNQPMRVAVLVQDDDVRWRLNDLLRVEAEHDDARHAGRKAQRGGIVDAAAVERFEHLRRGPRLIGGRFGAGGPLRRRLHRWPRWIAAGAAEADAAVGLLPRAAEGVPRLPDACQIGLLIRCARYCAARLRRGRRRERQDGCDDHEAMRAHHFTSTAAVLPPSPVPTGGPKNIFWPFGSVISRECAHGPPSRARHPVTVTRSPAFIVTSRFQPFR